MPVGLKISQQAHALTRKQIQLSFISVSLSPNVMQTAAWIITEQQIIRHMLIIKLIKSNNDSDEHLENNVSDITLQAHNN